MAGDTTGDSPLFVHRRKSLAGASGWAGLLRNRKVFSIAIFASQGGLLYGYNQGVFSGVLGMYTFDQRMRSAMSDPGKKGWLVAILELGAWFGVLVSGYLADKLSRKFTIFLATVVFSVGVIVQTTATEPSSIYGGRFVAGLGLGSSSMAVPLYNAELAPPEVRGSLVALQQLAIMFGVMISLWIDYGTNYIGGTGEGQSEAAWRIPLALQLVPAIILGCGIIFMPFSPRWLINQGRDDEALTVLSNLRVLPKDNDLVRTEFLEIKAQYLFEKEVSEAKFPQYQDPSLVSQFQLGLHSYSSLILDRNLLWRVTVGSLTMFFQQWTGVNAILYYAPSVFKSLGLTGNTLSLLATGVVGIITFLGTIPAVLFTDQLGRKPILISGAFLMATCHIIIAILTSIFHNSWQSHIAAGWVACSFVWVFALCMSIMTGFSYSWGPCSWIIITEIFPLSVRSKGLSIAVSANWMNHFIIGQVTPAMLKHLGYGTFIFFGIFSFLGGCFIMLLVPETKGVSLEEMEELFGNSTNLALEDLRHIEDIYKRLGLMVENIDVEEKHDEEIGKVSYDENAGKN